MFILFESELVDPEKFDETFAVLLGREQERQLVSMQKPIISHRSTKFVFYHISLFFLPLFKIAFPFIPKLSHFIVDWRDKTEMAYL